MAAKKKTTSDGNGANLVIVESPAKAKTIEKYLGSGFVVQASIGHVRDLPRSTSELPPSKRKHKYARLGVDLDNNFEPLYVVPASKKDQIQTLKSLLGDADTLWLATDEDREGESISWHLLEVLKPKVPVKRLVFNEITKGAIQRALESPREIDHDLVRAQESRRILDRLFGYEVSPVLWRKIRKGLSAGRVQSPALRLLVDRELERIRFRERIYWDLTGTFHPQDDKDAAFEALSIEIEGQRIAQGRDFHQVTGELQKKDVRILDAAAAAELVKNLEGKPGTVVSVEEKPFTQRPAAPFTTSTLQQEAGRKLRFSSQRAMRIAQTLYENGAITYMRTDSTTLSGEALGAARSLIADQYGDKYLPEKARIYTTKVKNAQEAHEAIRPAGSSFKSIEEVGKEHGRDAKRLYELIWKRTVASQMKNATGRRMTVRVQVGDVIFRATGRTIDFPGFMRAYVEGSDDPSAELAEKDKILPPLNEGQQVALASLEAVEHKTQPPARYTEASLVKELDKRGIGRPSTWASIISLLLDREYAFKKGNALVPTYTAIVLVRMLKEHFGDVTDYDFTARMEDELDAISRGELESKEYLRRFWEGNGTPGLHALIEQGLETADPRAICGIHLGEHEGTEIEVRVGRYGLFLTDGEHRASVPEDIVPDEFTVEKAAELLAIAARGPQALGTHPESGKPIYIKTGRYGPYVQLGDMVDGEEKPKMQSLLANMDPESIDLATALRLLSLPRDLGEHPEQDDKEHIFALTGRYGPYVKCGKESRSIPENISVLEITRDEAVALLKQPRRRGRQAAPKPPLKELGKHPESGAELKILDGRFGPYVTDGDVNASLPKSVQPDELEMDQAVELLERRRERIAAGGGRKKRGRKKKASKKKAAKKRAAKKKAAKKKAGKKKAGKKKAAKKAAAKKPDA